MALLALFAIGCDAAAEPRAADAEAIVREMFTAAEAGDCATLRRIIQGMNTEEACTEYVQGFRGEGISLLSVERVARDGRDPSAFLVHTRVMRDGQVREGVARAVFDENGRWTIVVR